MRKILFVCHGNICRSPMAEMIMKQLVRDAHREDDFLIDSAATSTEEIGNDIYPPAKESLRKHGVSFTRRAAKQMTRADYDFYDEIYVMDQNNLRYLHWDMPDVVRQLASGVYDDPNGKIQLLMSVTGSNRGVADPWYTDNFEATYRDVMSACQALLEC